MVCFRHLQLQADYKRIIVVPKRFKTAEFTIGKRRTGTKNMRLWNGLLSENDYDEQQGKCGLDGTRSI